MERMLYVFDKDNKYCGTEKTYSDGEIDISKYPPSQNNRTFITPPEYIAGAQIPVWEGEKWVIHELSEYAIPELTLNELKAIKSSDIRAESDYRIAVIQNGYSQGEIKSFEQQHQGALDILAGDETTQVAQFVITLLTGRLGTVPTSEEKIAFATVIKKNYDDAALASASILGIQQNLELRVRASTTKEELENIPNWLG